MPYQENFHEFSERHGNRRIKVGRSHLFPDGAILQEMGDELHRLLEPPTDPLELLRARRTYHAEWQKRAEHLFVRLKETMLGSEVPGFTMWNWRWPDWAGDDPKEPKDRLLALKAIVDEHKTAVAELDAEIEKQPAVIEQRRREALHRRMEDERRAADTKYRAELSAINL